MVLSSDWWSNELYSQFGEDGVALGYFRTKAYAARGRIDDIGRGFFVDVGCHHPVMLSNTWYFYQRGWRGINIDPTPGVKAEFDALRPEDVNLQLAIAGKAGQATFYSYGRAVANTLNPGQVDFSQNPEEITVETRTLQSVLDDHCPPRKEIDLLSVDVEGLDAEVLRSNDWNKHRPSLVIVEMHSDDIGKVLSSEIYGLMTAWDYRMYGWAQPSIIFARN